MKISIVTFSNLLLALILLAASEIPLFGQYEADKAAAQGAPIEGRTVIMGTWYWDIESNSQGKITGSDLWWQQVDDVQQFLVPLGATGITLLENRDFSSIGVEDLKALKYGRCPIENIKLGPDSILAVKTVEGNYVKIRIIGYREMHDLSFPDTRYGRQSWFAYLLTRPNNLKYHLEVDWTMFPRNKAAQL